MYEIKKLLDAEVVRRNQKEELSFDNPDPLLVARASPNEYKALVCALFSYGNAKQIVKFLSALDFSLLDADEETIKRSFMGVYYRFQNAEDIQELFITLSRMKRRGSLEDIFILGYQKEQRVIEGIFEVIKAMEKANPFKSRGYLFLVGKAGQSSPYKRWLMYLRWMVRNDNLDLGLWKGVERKDLLLPLDTHTFRLSRKLGLLQRKSYDLKAVIEVTEALKRFDPADPVKYDFALYRLGQSKKL